MQKSNEAWNAFFSLLRLRKENKLPPFMKRVSPPGYWKDRESRRGSSFLLLGRIGML